MKIWLAVILGLGLLLAPLAADAAPIQQDLTYVLSSHPDGGENPPPYGLRLDGLDGDTSNEWTFDFDHPDSSMRMRWSSSDNSLHIWGNARGGEDIGSSYSASTEQLFAIDFTYSEVLEFPGDQLRSTAPFPNGSATITPLSLQVGSFPAGSPIDLIDYMGSHEASFFIETGHRGFAGVSGYGWLNHAGAPGGLADHVSASDWLFTAKPIPEPGSVTLFCVGALIVGFALRRSAA